MADIASLVKALKDKAIAQYDKGAPYRQALVSALRGDTQGINQALSKSDLTPMDFATTFAPMGITAWHGTPHEIVGNKFDLSKIGTGEGAQAFGHGLYFAEAPAVAKTYQMPSRGAEATAAHHLKMYKTPENAIMALEDQLGSNITQLGRQHTQEAIDLIKSGKATTGNLYKVDIADETIPKMLDWNKTLVEQPQEVRNFATNLAKQTDTWNNYFSQLNPKAQKLANEMISGTKPMVGNESAKYWKQLDKLNPNVDHNAMFDSLYEAGLRSGQRDITGADLYNNLTRKLFNENNTNAPAMASQHLLENGIPGISYLDAASRLGNEGTRNFVVFNPETVKILQKNGIDLP